MRSTTRSTPRRFEVRASPVRSARDHEAALARIESLMHAKPGTAEGAELEILAILVQAYEREHFPIGPPDPVDALRFRLEQGELDRKALERVLGSRSRVSEVLNRKRPLTLAMIRGLHKQFHIPLESLVGGSVS